MSNLTLYFFGFIILIAGVAWGASLLGAPPTWIGVGVVILAGIAIMSSVSNTRHREVSPVDQHSKTVVVER